MRLSGTPGLLVVTCGLVPHAIGGHVSGLTATDSLVLTNGTTGGTATITAAMATYTFPTQVTFNSSYGVTILTQPTGQTCTVANPVGIMADLAIDNIDVTCVTKT